MKKTLLLLLTLLTISCVTLKKDSKSTNNYLLVKKNGDYFITNKIDKNQTAVMVVEINKKNKINNFKGKVQTSEMKFMVSLLKEKSAEWLIRHIPCECTDGNGNKYGSEFCEGGCVPTEWTKKFIERFPRFARTACCLITQRVMNKEKIYR
jgi:hypothetical protein